jgi:hypothetical protein
MLVLKQRCAYVVSSRAQTRQVQWNLQSLKCSLGKTANSPGQAKAVTEAYEWHGVHRPAEGRNSAFVCVVVVSKS